jgi:glycosyltransferase involved in cell wall biosynthesis
MLIGIDASRANRDHKSGTEWYSYYLIRWLAKLDEKNQYILYSDKPLKGGLLDLTTKQYVCESRAEDGEVEYDKNGFQILKSPHNNFKVKILKWPFNFFWTQGRLSLEMIFHRPDLLFVPSHTLPLIHPEKSIVTIHDIGFERDRLLYGSDQMGPKDKAGKKIINFFVKLFTFGKFSANSTDYLRWSTTFALKKAEKIITVSNYSKKEIIEVYKDLEKEIKLKDKIKVIHNGYNQYLYGKEKAAEEINLVLKKYDLQKPYILYIGRLEKKKNTPALIEAFAIMRENNKGIKHKLVLVGDAGFCYDEVKYMIQEYLLEDEVIMTGWLEEEDMPFVYCGADLFVFPSLYEGFGIPILQAMACGVPVAASRTTSIPEVTGDAAILFNPRNVNEIATAMEKIIKDGDLRNELIEKGKKQVENFSWEKCARETLEIINRMGG